ncbi:hypothetical protein [Agrobacterium sp. 22-221-1]
MHENALRRIAQREMSRRDRVIADAEYERALRRRTNIVRDASPYEQAAQGIRQRVWYGHEGLLSRVKNWFVKVA